MLLDREEYFFTPRYTRGEVCTALGLTKDALRHYEKCKLVNPIENEINKYKYYSIADLEILNVIVFLRAMDVPISEIPKFIECKDIDNYSDFLDEQINRAISKIEYWTQIKNILKYLKTTVEDYKKMPLNVKVVKNTRFIFRKAKFNYDNYDIKKMSPTKISPLAMYNVIKLKIVEDGWIESNREDTSALMVGHLCDEAEIDNGVCEHNIPVALMISTLEVLDKIGEIIKENKNKYKDKYEFTEKIYIIEHTFFNIFNQEALLRNIYLPIKKVL